MKSDFTFDINVTLIRKNVEVRLAFRERNKSNPKWSHWGTPWKTKPLSLKDKRITRFNYFEGCLPLQLHFAANELVALFVFLLIMKNISPPNSEQTADKLGADDQRLA